MRDGGIIKLYNLVDRSQPGEMPKEELVYASQSYFSYRTASIERRYAALGANRDFNFVVRLHNVLFVDEKYAIINGVQYRIDNAEPIFDADSADLTLVKLEALYDVAEQT